MKLPAIKIWIYSGHNNKQPNLTEKQQIGKLKFLDTTACK